MKRIKNVFTFLVAVFVLVYAVAGISESSIVQHHVDVVDIEIPLPKDWYYADESVTDDNPLCKLLNKTAEQFSKDYFSDSCFMVAYDANNGISLYLYLLDSDYENYSDLSDAEIKEIGEKDYNWLTSSRYSVESKDVVSFNKPYYKLICQKDGMQNVFYQTSYYGDRHTFQFVYKNDNRDDAVEKLCDSIIRNVVYWDERQEIDEAAEARKAAEKTAAELSVSFGLPVLRNVESYDYFLYDVNARTIYIGNNKIGYELAVMIRATKEQIYFWGLDFSVENFEKAKTIFVESAPECGLAYFAGDKLIDSASYMSDTFPWKEFVKKVDSISKMLLKKGSSNTMNLDPVLSLFPDIEWGMTKDKVLDNCGRDKLIDMSANGKTILTAFVDIYGEDVAVILGFENEKLNSISTIYSEEKTGLYVDDLTKLYGTPVRTSHLFAYSGLSGNILEDKDGDTYVWKTGDTLVVLTLQGAGAVEYYQIQ